MLLSMYSWRSCSFYTLHCDCTELLFHDDALRMVTLVALLALWWGIYRSSADSLYKRPAIQRADGIFSLSWTSSWTNNRLAGVLKLPDAHQTPLLHMPTVHKCISINAKNCVVDKVLKTWSCYHNAYFAHQGDVTLPLSNAAMFDLVAIDHVFTEKYLSKVSRVRTKW